MGFFVEKSKVIEKGKKYVVYKSKPIPSYLFAIVTLIMFILYCLIIFKIISGKMWYYIDITSLIVFSLLVVVRSAEVWEGSFAVFRNKQIIKKGSTAFSFSNPLETWIER